MIKSWYLHVRDETMAPARMVSFMEEHVIDCEICRQDPDLKEEIAKITELVLPESKIPKAIRQKNSEDDEDSVDSDDSDDIVDDEDEVEESEDEEDSDDIIDDEDELGLDDID